MMRKIAALLLVVAMVLTFAGCAKKVTVSVEVTNIGDFEIAKIPEGFASLGLVERTINLAVKKDGEYPLVLKGEDGTEHTLLIKYEKGTVTTEAEDLEFTAHIN